MVTKTMPVSSSSSSSGQVGSWSKLFGTQRQRTYRGEQGRYTSYESKAASQEKTFTRDSYVPTRYTGVGGDYNLDHHRSDYRKTTTSSYDRLGTQQSTRRSNYRSASVDRDVERSLRDTDKYFHQQFPHASRRKDEEEEEENDVLKRVRRKLRQRSYSVDREVSSSSGDYGAPFRVVPKREERYAGVINNQKRRAKLGERIEEIYNTKYTRPSRTSTSSSYALNSTSSSSSSAFSRYVGDSSDDAYSGLDYRTLIDGIPNRHRARGLSADRARDVTLRSGSRVSVERELGQRATSASRMADHHEMAFERARRQERRAASVSHYEDLRGQETEYFDDHKRKSAALMRNEYGTNYVKDFNTDRHSGRDLSSLVLDQDQDFQPDHVRVINLSSGKQAVSFDRTTQSGHGASKSEADAAIEHVIQRTRTMEQSMYTLEDFVRKNRSLFPEDTQIQQQIRFFQLNELELQEMGEAPDSVVYGVKIKEKLIVPRGYDVTVALNKYYGNKGSAHVELEERHNIRQQAEHEIDMSNEEMQQSFRKKIEKEFEDRDASRILGDQHITVKEANRQVDHRDRYSHLHSHLTPEYIKSYYVNAGLDYDSIYEISRGRRSSLGSMQSDAESVCTRTSRASSGGGASSRRGGNKRGTADTAPNFTAKLRGKKCEEDGTVRFNASVSGLPMPDVAWFKSNRLITEGGRFHISNNYGLLSLEITKVKRDDAGIYTVKAQNVEGEVACSAPLDVQELETFTEKKDGTKKPWFVVEAQNTWAEVGGRATFEAQASGAPVPAFRWQRDNINLTENDRVRVFTDETGHVKLVIRNVTHADAGLYFCIADNRTGKAKCAATLRIVDKGQLEDRGGRASRETTPLARGRRGSMSRDTTPVPPPPLPEHKPMPNGNEPWFIQKPAATISCHEGDVLTLKSIVDGDPKPKVTWLKEPHRELNYSKRHRVVASGEHHMMEITSTVQTDAGRFICLAENQYGRIAAATFVNMLPPRTEQDDDLEAAAHFIKLPEYDYEIELNKERGKMAPLFTKRLPISKEVEQGDNLEVRCRVEEADTPEYTKDFNIKTTVTGEASIKTVTIGKGGVVKSDGRDVRAVSPASSTSTTTAFKVAEEERAAEAKAEAAPEAAPAPAPEAAPTTPKAAPEASPAVAAPTMEDDIEAPIEVTLKEPVAPVAPAVAPAAPAADPNTQAPVFERELEDKSVKIGKAVKLGVKVSGKPTPKVVFFKNGKVMEEEGDTYDIESKGDEYYIEFCDVEASDAGEYSCTATNASGTASSSGSLILITVSDVPPPAPEPEQPAVEEDIIEPVEAKRKQAAPVVVEEKQADKKEEVKEKPVEKEEEKPKEVKEEEKPAEKEEEKTEEVKDEEKPEEVNEEEKPAEKEDEKPAEKKEEVAAEKKESSSEYESSEASEDEAEKEEEKPEEKTSEKAEEKPEEKAADKEGDATESSEYESTSADESVDASGEESVDASAEASAEESEEEESKPKEKGTAAEEVGAGDAAKSEASESSEEASTEKGSDDDEETEDSDEDSSSEDSDEEEEE